VNVIKGSHLRALQHAVNAGEASAPDGDLTDRDINDLESVANLLRSLKRGTVLVPMSPVEAMAVVRLISSIDNATSHWTMRRDLKRAANMITKLYAVARR